MISFKIKAYGKINPFLYVGEKRPDGFHQVVTVMQKASLYDTVELTETEEKGIRIISNNATLPCDSDNLVYRAIEELHKAIGRPIETINTGYTVKIEKNIPIAGGMGGGSADAGYVLKHLNLAMNEPLSREELRRIAASLGSDIPFFVFDHDAMLATGRGEILTPCPSLPSCRMEFISCGKKLSTGSMFASLDAARTEGDTVAPDVKDILSALESGDLSEICKYMYNSFETVFKPHNTEAFSEAEKKFRENGAVGVILCGSGPTVCGIFPANDL